jgi:hypothetical protein
MNIIDIFEKYGFYLGRMISPYKETPNGCRCVWNANIITKSQGKIWYGDINITKDAPKLKLIADELKETLYILRERDCRFDTENDPIDSLINRSIWNTAQEII